MTGKNQWVVPINGGDQWGVRGEGNERITSIHDTQREAIGRARGEVAPFSWTGFRFF